MENIVISISTFACLFGCLYVYMTTRHRERMAMIEKGIQYEFGKKMTIQNIWMKIAFLSIGVGIGLLLGALLNEFTLIESGICYGSMVALCGGFGLIASHYIKSNKGE